MNTTTQTDWMTGDEFNRERLRLIREGVPDEDPRFVALRRRMMERNHHLFEKYGKQLIEKYPNWYVAIAADGRTLVRKYAGDAEFDGEAEFQTYDFAVFRLSDPPYDRFHC